MLLAMKNASSYIKIVYHKMNKYTRREYIISTVRSTDLARDFEPQLYTLDIRLQARKQLITTHVNVIYLNVCLNL